MPPPPSFCLPEELTEFEVVRVTWSGREPGGSPPGPQLSEIWRLHQRPRKIFLARNNSVDGFAQPALSLIHSRIASARRPTHGA